MHTHIALCLLMRLFWVCPSHRSNKFCLDIYLFIYLFFGPPHKHFKLYGPARFQIEVYSISATSVALECVLSHLGETVPSIIPHHGLKTFWGKKKTLPEPLYPTRACCKPKSERVLVTAVQEVELVVLSAEGLAV